MTDHRVADEELLTVGPGDSGRRRTVLVVAVLVVVAGLALGIVVSNRAGHHPHAVNSPHPSAPPPSAAPPSGVPVGAGSADTPALLMNGFVYIIREGLLYMHAATRPIINETVVGRFRRPDAAYLLVGDAAHRRIWAVQTIEPSWTAYEYDAATLEQLDARGANGSVAGAAVLGGDLYVNTDVGVVRDVGRAARRLESTGIRGGRAIAADPGRGRLLLLDLDGANAQIRGQSSTSHTIVAARAPVLVKGDIAVVGGHIWVGGFGERGALLYQLDPRSLRRLGASPLEAALGPGAVIVASGAHDFLVRSGGGGDQLWCVDGRSGAVRQTWAHVGDPVVLGGDGPGPRVYTLDSGFTPRPLAGAGCRG